MPQKIDLYETPDNRTVKEIVRNLLQDAGRLARDEVRLARAELTEKLIPLRGAGLTMLIAVGAAVFSAACLVAACVAALALITPVWFAAVLVGLLLALVSGGAFLMGRRQLRHFDMMPRRTIATLEGHFEWAKRQTE